MTNPQTLTVTTKDGHIVQFFFNKETNLVVVDYVHHNERGGCELLRVHLDDVMLRHCEEIEDA